MPLFVLIGRDGPRGLERRTLHRPAHLEGLRPLDREGRIPFAGPLLDEGSPRGSVIVFEAADRAEALALAERDPYVAEGIFETWEVFETLRVFPEG